MFHKGFCCEEVSTLHSVNIIECIASKVSNFCCYVLSRFSLVFFCYAGTLNSIRLDCFHMTSLPPCCCQQQVVTLRLCASRWTEVCGGIGSQRMQQRKMAPLLKITIVLVICSIFVECRSDKVFFVICEIGLKANKSQIIHNFARFVVHE